LEAMKVLIVDDEESITAYLKRKLDRLGYIVWVAENGEVAIDLAFTHLPDLMLLDIKLPKLSGIEVCERLKSDERTRDIAILMLSAKAQSGEIEKGLKAGADKYLCKPMGFQDILKEIQAFG